MPRRKQIHPKPLKGPPSEDQAASPTKVSVGSSRHKNASKSTTRKGQKKVAKQAGGTTVRQQKVLKLTKTSVRVSKNRSLCKAKIPDMEGDKLSTRNPGISQSDKKKTTPKITVGSHKVASEKGGLGSNKTEGTTCQAKLQSIQCMPTNSETSSIRPESICDKEGTRGSGTTNQHTSDLEVKTDEAEGSSSEEDSKTEAIISENGQYICPVCDHALDSPHAFTVHIRQHNPSDHSHTCRLCGKTLSSASSLDRHMLVHSGERPFKCKVCNMAFTTNGNMHRHMRTHSETEESPEAPKPSKDPKPKLGVKRKSETEEASDPSSKKPDTQDEPREKDAHQLHCPVCGKSFLCKYGLQTHMEVHPNDPIRCQECGNILSNYVAYVTHKCLCPGKASETDPTPSSPAPIGFQDLTFVDFSSEKFSLIAKSFCEHNQRRPSSAFHNFECARCKKAFPSGSALRLHQMTHVEKMETYCPSCHCDFQSSSCLQVHQLRHRTVEHCAAEDLGEPEDDNHDLSVDSDHAGSEKKEDFMALLELQNRDNQPSSATPRSDGNDQKPEKEKDRFESLEYFVHGKRQPQISGGLGTEIHSDFADIQSIISVTSRVPSIRSSPVAASPAPPPPPPQAISCQRPESPMPADSANASPETPSKEDSEPLSEKGGEEPETEVPVEKEKIYFCKRCSLSFKSPNALKRHSRLHSQSNNNYSCNMCPYTSLDKSTLIRHLRTHNGERPFQCAICKYAFTTKANCERHVRKRHKKLTKQEIRSAMQYNPNMSELRISEMLSADIANSETVCRYCNVDFKFNRVLRHHLRSLHNSCSRKPFFCTLCRLGFSTKNNCIRHVLKQHPEKKDKLSEVVTPNAQSDTSDQESLHLSDESPQKEPCEPVRLASEPLNLSVRVQELVASCGLLDENDLSSIDDIVSAANSLVSLSEMPPPQDEPLDCSIQALDLSVKLTPEKSGTEPKPTSIYSLSQYYLSSTPSPQPYHLPPGGQSSDSADSLMLPTLTMVPSTTGIQLPSPCPDEIYKMTFKIVNDKLSPRNQRSFTCTHCLAGFTLKSNMERHIKRKHPEFARPTRSRNFIPNLATSDTPKPTTPTLSNKTRTALRVVLSNKASALASTSSHVGTEVKSGTDSATPLSPSGQDCGSNVTVVQEDSQTTQLVPAESEILQEKGDVVDADTSSAVQSTYAPPDTDSDERSRDGENPTDLASVSSVIDTANSQAFKQLLAEVRSDENHNLTSEDCKELALESSSRPNSPPDETGVEKNGNSSLKKRSSYTDSPNSVVCPFCSRTFPWTSSLRRHILTHTGQKPFKCPRCPIWFTTKSNCERHLMRKHGRNGDMLTRSVPERPYKCNVCPSSTFSTQGNLRKHFYLKHWTKTGSGKNFRLLHFPKFRNTTNATDGSDEEGDLPHSASCEEDGSNTQSGPDSALSIERKGETSEENMKCQCCGKSFASSQELDVHVRQHTDLPFKCHICDESYAKRQDCLDHFKLCHSALYQLLLGKGALDQNAQEQDCPGMASPVKGSNTASNNSNEEDAEQVKSKTMDYVQRKVICAFCLRRFWSMEDLRRHMRTHSGERPFSCDICQRKFSLKHSMLRHRRKHLDSSSSLQDSTDEDCPIADGNLARRKNAVQNSLLYLLPPKDSCAAAQKWNLHGSSSDSKLPVSSANVAAGAGPDDDNMDLIQNLLGIHDSTIIDQMLDSADSAARLLGMEEV